VGKTLRVGILRETKDPPDKRVPLSPSQIVEVEEMFPDIEFFVQPSDFRCFTDDEYDYLEIPLSEDLSHCDILMGIKEVDPFTIIPGKIYVFFPHVTKEQPYNGLMFKELVSKEVTLIDYELLSTGRNTRSAAFGRFAGIIGAYNGLRARGISSGRFVLKQASQCHDLQEMWAGLKLIQLKPGLKILVTGNGKVAHGAMETLGMCDTVTVTPEDFLEKEFDVPVICKIGPASYVRHTSGIQYSSDHFKKHPGEYVSTFSPFYSAADILVTGHFWDPRSPVFFTQSDMMKEDFRISVIADVSCDINGPIPSTIRPSTISDPFYDYNPITGKEETAFSRKGNIAVMAVDNLPGELPRSASYDFGEQLIRNVLYDLFFNSTGRMVGRATIIKKGMLTPQFEYLSGYLAGS
jgi:alanine dehydrogenase